MARPETVGPAMPTGTVARPPFWLAALVVTTGIVRSAGFTDASSCLPRSLSKIENYCGEDTSKDTRSGVNQAPQVCCCKLDNILDIKPEWLKGKIDVW